MEHSEHGDLIHPSLRILDARTGKVVADLRDEARAMCSFAWSPIPGDRRIAIGHERRGERAPAIWNIDTGEVTDLPLPWDRFTEVADWWPDASAVLLFELRDGRNYLHRYDLATGEITPLAIEEGSLTGARVRPDGTVWYRLQRGEHPGLVFESGREEPILAPAAAAPAGRPFMSVGVPESARPAGPRLDRGAGWARSRGRPSCSSTAARRRSTSIAGRPRSRPTSTWASASRCSTTAARSGTAPPGAMS